MASTICREVHTADFSSSIVSSPETKGFLIQDGCSENRLDARLVSPLTIRFAGLDQSSTDNKMTKSAILSPETSVTGSRRWEILFDFDSVDLDAEDLSVLDSVPSGLKVRVDGYACRLGSDVYNRKLSAHRAAVIAKSLEKRGVTVAVQEGRGECCPISETDLARNRRAVVMEVE